MTPARTRSSAAGVRVAVATVIGSLVLLGAEVGAVLGTRTVLDQRAYVTGLRLDAALETFRPVDHPGLASPVGPRAFTGERNPRTAPAGCAPLTVLTTTAPEDGRSWTGVNGRPAQPVTLLTARFANAAQARAEVERKRVALLRCTEVSVTFPPFDGPPTVYTVTGRRWPVNAVGPVVRWSLMDGDRRFDFYMHRYANTLTWTYADDVSTPQVREDVARSLVARLRDLAHR